MKLGLCRYCSDYAELDYGLCARCLDFELDRKRPTIQHPEIKRYEDTPFKRGKNISWEEASKVIHDDLVAARNVSAANNPALLRCPRCTLIIRKEGECPYCESARTQLQTICRICGHAPVFDQMFCSRCGVRHVQMKANDARS